MKNEEWKECVLGDIIEFKNGRKRPENNGNFPVYGGNGILAYVDQYNYENCIAIGRVGAYCGSIYYEKNKCWISDNAIVATAKGQNCIVFCCYLLKTLCLNKRCIGTGQPLLTQEILNRIVVSIPSVECQNKIAKILSALDDKIELNNAINRNLEEQAQALFKNWFVDFAPFGGKMPEDWQIGKLSDIAEYEKQKINISELTEETYYSTEIMLPNRGGICRATNLPSIDQTTKCFPGETIISNIRPYFKKIFYCTENIAGCSTDVLCFKPKKKTLEAYNYFLLCSDNFFDYMIKGSKGTKMPRGDKTQIMNYDVVVPTESVISDFNTVVSNILQQTNNNKKENECLAKLRDTLLPDLMSGEVD